MQMISQQSHSTYLHLPSIFFQSFFFFAISPLPCKCFLSFSFRVSLNCKVATQSANFKIKNQFYWQNSEKVLRSSVPSLLSAEEDLLILISNTILIFKDCQCHSTHDKPEFLFSSHQCLLPSNLVLPIENVWDEIE